MVIYTQWQNDALNASIWMGSLVLWRHHKNLEFRRFCRPGPCTKWTDRTLALAGLPQFFQCYTKYIKAATVTYHIKRSRTTIFIVLVTLSEPDTAKPSKPSLHKHHDKDSRRVHVQVQRAASSGRTLKNGKCKDTDRTVHFIMRFYTRRKTNEYEHEHGLTPVKTKSVQYTERDGRLIALSYAMHWRCEWIFRYPAVEGARWDFGDLLSHYVNIIPIVVAWHRVCQIQDTQSRTDRGRRTQTA